MLVYDNPKPGPLTIFVAVSALIITIVLFSLSFPISVGLFIAIGLLRFVLGNWQLPKGTWFIIGGYSGMVLFGISTYLKITNHASIQDGILNGENSLTILIAGEVVFSLMVLWGIINATKTGWQGRSTWAFEEEQQNYVHCARCRAKRPTKQISFDQNIGMLVVRQYKNIKGQLCKSCINRCYTEYTLITLALGWWGTISFVFTPIIVVMNTTQFLTAWLVPPLNPRLVDTISDEALTCLQPNAEDILRRVKAGENLNGIARDVSRSTKVSLEETRFYILSLIQQSQQKS